MPPESAYNSNSSSHSIEARFEDLMWFLVKDLEARTIIPIGLEIFHFAKTYFVYFRCNNTLITIFNSL